MKTLLYSLIAIFISGIIATGFINNQNTDNSILIQSTDKNISAVLLSQSAKIISDRLKDFSSEKFSLIIIPEKNQIQVMFADSRDLKDVENLLTKKGSIEFYETYNHDELSELLKGDNNLFSLLTRSNTDDSGTKIGCTSITEVEKISRYLNTLELNQICKFTWKTYSDTSTVCLFALKISSNKGAVITGADIESAKYNLDKIQIKLKKAAIGIWSDGTKRNLNRVIAIVIDNNVISSPRVRSVIDSGEIEITGSFTKAQAGYMAALLNNGELPVNFQVVK
jgi:preprotein translocase subunit SecD